MVYKLKTWRLPLGGRTSAARPSSTSCRSPGRVGIAAIMPVDRDEDHWDELQIVFATSAGDVRRNALSDFTNVMRNGKIAMKLPEDGKRAWRLVNARICPKTMT
jgi:DNA gyrase subunit A